MAVAMSRAQIVETARTRGCYLRIRHGKHISQPLPPGRPWAVQIAFRNVINREALAGSFPTHEQAVEFALGRLAELKDFAR
ncbi:hypothetical protein ACWDUD_01430 [Rhodococcus sp. NPDC003382]|uniref:hypothetical protein n=1 Tax=Rhodococcus sp. CX TaxID=2789880 RepID=UPI0018CDB9C9|nr:hypothetical protein [Rhodococcus sp. CX]MBH0123655.1 hypothetical protein [Rhodococcus sp. CX]